MNLSRGNGRNNLQLLYDKYTIDIRKDFRILPPPKVASVAECRGTPIEGVTGKDHVTKDKKGDLRKQTESIDTIE